MQAKQGTMSNNTPRGRMPAVCARLGFTLIELLVVIAIIGVLVAILLPAIQQARSAARRSVCKSNLKQIGIAILNYHDAMHAYPLTMTDGGGDKGGNNCRTGLFSWRAQILPYMEQQELYDRINFNVTMGDRCQLPTGTTWLGGKINTDHTNADVARKVVAAFLCPDDGYLPTTTKFGTAVPAPDNYVANMGWPSNSTGINGERTLYPDPDHPTDASKRFGMYNGLISVANPNPNVRIAWHPRKAISSRDVIDGTQHTAMVSERLIQVVEDANTLATTMNKVQPNRFFACSLNDTDFRTQQELIDRAHFNSQNVDALVGLAVPYVGRAWISGWPLEAPTYMHVWPPNTGNSMLHGGENDGNMMYGPSSNHLGGVNLLMADGTVRWVGNGIDHLLWWRIGTRDGQEIVEDF